MEEKNEIKMNSEVKEQQVKNKKKLKIVPVLVTIILILVLALALCIGNMYAMTKDHENIFSMASSIISGQEAKSEENAEKDEVFNSEQENNEISSILENKNKGYVYQRESLYSKYSREIEIPYININSEDAKKVNQEIYEMYENASNLIKVLEDKNHNPSEVYEYTELTYKYSIIDNLLCVCVDKTPIVVPGGGFVKQRTVYNFNVQDGKRMSIQEILKKFDLNEEQLIEKINTQIKENHLSDVVETKEWTTEKLSNEGFKYDIKELYFESETIIRLILELPYGYEEMLLDISNFDYINESYDEEQEPQDESNKYQDYIGAWVCEEDNNIQLVISDINDEGITVEIISYLNYSYGKKTFKFTNNLNKSAEFHIENGATSTKLGGYIDLVEDGIELRTIGISNDSNIKSGTKYKLTKKIDFEKYVKTWKDSDGKFELKVLNADHLGMEFEIIVEGKSYGIINKTYGYAYSVGIVNFNLMDEKNNRVANIDIVLSEDDIRLALWNITDQSSLKQGTYILKAQ